MNNKYQLIHIDTLESVMCEKITIDNKDYYVEEGVSYDLIPNFSDAIATTNPSIKCPQVVDYVKELSKKLQDSNHIIARPCFEIGFKIHAETHSLSDEEVLALIQSLKDYTYEAEKVLGYDDREPMEFLEQFKSTLPIKVYYK